LSSFAETPSSLQVVPAWDEKDGLDIDVSARTKRDAIKSARRQIADAGHLGRMSFKATETAGMLDLSKTANSSCDYNLVVWIGSLD